MVNETVETPVRAVPAARNDERIRLGQRARRGANGELATAMRWGAVSLVLIDVLAGRAQAHALASTAIVVVVTVALTAGRVRDAATAAPSGLVAAAETAIYFGAVIWSGGWNSPLVLALGVAIFVGGLVEGIAGILAALGVLAAGSAAWLLIAPTNSHLAISGEGFVAMTVVGNVGVYAGKLSARERQRSAALERERIVRNLHDGLAQAVAAIGLELDRLAEEWSREVPGALPHVEKALLELAEQVREMNRQVRGELQDLRGGTPVRRDLTRVVTELLAEVERRSSIATEFDHRATTELPERVDRELCFIAREAILNAERHADASRITVVFDVVLDALVLEVTDDGCGLRAPRAGAYGLAGMRERAVSLGADLYIGPRGTRGTAVRLTLSLVRS